MITFDWKWAGLLALLGPVFGVATIFALIQGLEHIVALGIVVFIGVASAVLARPSAIGTAFAAGCLAALAAILLQALFIDTYFANNPAYAEIPIPLGFSAAAWTSLFAPVGGFITGVLSALAAGFVKLVLPRRQPA